MAPLTLGSTGTEPTDFSNAGGLVSAILRAHEAENEDMGLAPGLIHVWPESVFAFRLGSTHNSVYGTATERYIHARPTWYGYGSDGQLERHESDFNRKFTMAHEFGHAVQDLSAGHTGNGGYDFSLLDPQTGNRVPQDDPGAFPPECRCQQVAGTEFLPAHCMMSVETSGPASGEGFAHFFAARLWNMVKKISSACASSVGASQGGPGHDRSLLLALVAGIVCCSACAGERLPVAKGSRGAVGAAAAPPPSGVRVGGKREGSQCIPPSRRPLPEITCPGSGSKEGAAERWLEKEGVCCEYVDAVAVPPDFQPASRERCRTRVVPGAIPQREQLLYSQYSVSAFEVGFNGDAFDATTEENLRVLARPLDVVLVVAWPAKGAKEPGPATRARAEVVRGRLVARGIKDRKGSVQVVSSSDPRASFQAQCLTAGRHEISICAWSEYGGPVREKVGPGASFVVSLPKTVGSFDVELCKNRACSGARVTPPSAPEGEIPPRVFGRLAGGLPSVLSLERLDDGFRLIVRAPVRSPQESRDGDEFVVLVNDAASGEPRCAKSWYASYGTRAEFAAELACHWYSASGAVRICPAPTETPQPDSGLKTD